MRFVRAKICRFEPAKNDSLRVNDPEITSAELSSATTITGAEPCGHNNDGGNLMKGLNVLLACLLALLLVAPVFSQSTNSTLTGTISDSSGAVLPGVTVTATNTATEVATTALTNESGSYNLPSLLPGTYKVSAELAGFRTQSFTDVRLGNADQIRLN